MAKAGKQTDAAYGMMPAPKVRARLRRARCGLELGELTSRALAAMGVLLILLLSVAAVGAGDVSTQTEFRVAHAESGAAVEASVTTREGPTGAWDVVEDATDEATDDEAPSVDASTPAGSAAEPSNGSDPSSPNQLWLVNTRKLPDCPCVHCDTGRVEVYRYECGTGWQRSSRQAFLAAGGADFVTTVFVHGNDTDAAEARDQGQQLYTRLTSTACPSRPVQFVIWSWPSERIFGRVRSDIQAKASRANAEAFYLADFLDELDPDARVSLSGYSLGARVTTGALHLLGGGALEGRQLETRQRAERSGVRVVLLAAAVADDWLLPGRRYERAVSQADRLVVMYNPLDAVLRFYPLMYGRGGPAALGYTGISHICRLGEDRQKVCELNVSGAVHRRHGWGHYVNSPWIIRRLRHELLMHDKTTAEEHVDRASYVGWAERSESHETP